MKKILLISLIFIVGCEGSPYQIQSEAKKNRKAMISLSPELTKNDVLKIMGKPRNTEFYISEGSNIELWFYLIEGETIYVPLLFKNDKLIGWGSRYVDEHIKKYEVRIR